MILVLPPFSEAIGVGKRRRAGATPGRCVPGGGVGEGPVGGAWGVGAGFSVSTQHLLTLNTR